MSGTASDARTFLFVPGNRPDRYSKAIASGAGQIVIDLEDAVAPTEKQSAREDVQHWLESGGAGMVRINGLGTAWFEDDIRLMSSMPRVVMLPKASVEATNEVGRRLTSGSAIVALIETAAGVSDSLAIAQSPHVIRLAFGNVDLSTEIGVSPDDRQALLFARSTLVLASAAARIPGPIDGVTTSVGDLDMVLHDAQHAASLGFKGKLCIHPRQVSPTRRAFLPSADQLGRAERIVAAAGDGNATALDGQMLDKPIIDGARRLIADAQIAGS